MAGERTLEFRIRNACGGERKIALSLKSLKLEIFESCGFHVEFLDHFRTWIIVVNATIV